MVQTSHLNIEKIIDLGNVDRSSTLVENMDTFDMNNIFPIKNNEELVSFETSINNKDFRNLLVILHIYLGFF